MAETFAVENEPIDKEKFHKEKEQSDDPNDYGKMLENVLWARPEIPWDDVAGLTEEKKMLAEYIVLPEKFPQLLKDKTRDYGACLLYGAPGTGKTLLARALGSELCNSKFLHVAGSELASKWLSPEGKLTAELFRYAKRNKPCVIFVDDIDLICNVDCESNMARNVRAELVVHLEEARKEGIQVIAASAIPWMIDDQVRQRFSKFIYLPLPDQQARENMIKMFFSVPSSSVTPHTLTGEDIKLAASKTDGYTGSDLMCIVRDALMEPVRKLQKATHFCKVKGPSSDDQGKTLDDLWTPCLPNTPDAIETNVFQIPENELLVPKVTLEDLLIAVNKSKPTVSEFYQQMYADFNKKKWNSNNDRGKSNHITC